jgi:D-alanyl-D-alanine carboxypeptidase/D-alanyl-D-alanine-endopeptidase (penicillin-binding protein 4)
VANEILIAMGAHVHGPPGTLDKGLMVIHTYCREVLRLSDIQISEGSGISRENRVTPLAMWAILKAFESHRALLPRDGRLLYKTGSMQDVRTIAGYMERPCGPPHYFVVLMNRQEPDMNPVVKFLKDLALGK